MNYINIIFLTIVFGLNQTVAAANSETVEISSAEITAESSETWNSQLKEFYFPDINIIESNALFDFEVPYRAEDGAMVPIDIKAKIPQSKEQFIKSYSVIIDENPKPLAGTFEFSPLNGKADLAMRIRVNAYSLVRVVGETNDGEYYMVSRYVKSSGGCSAPASTDAATALARLGKIRLKTPLVQLFDKPVKTRLAISHPNTSGLQKDQVTTLFIPPHYISKIEVKFNEEAIFTAETDISISENPNFKFYFVPQESGVLTTTVTDTEGNKFTQTEKLKASVE
jgi:sulfur-oxidizing protein SoxY